MGIFDALEGLGTPTDLEATSFPCVRLELRDGASFDVYRADRASPNAQIWRVRGFLDRGGSTREQRALILGTTDGRAMLNLGNTLSPDNMADNTVTQATPVSRPIEDLSEAMAKAVRALFGDEPN